MKYFLLPFLGIFGIVATASLANERGSSTAAGNDSSSAMVFVRGGSLPQISGVRPQVAPFSFHIGRYEVTWGEWKKVRAWAVENGYDLEGVGAGAGDDYPVHSIPWIDALKWCNAKSEKEGLTPVYRIRGEVLRTGLGNDPVMVPDANGYRLPTEEEWEFAARGGASSRGYIFSGGDDLDVVGWYRANSGGGPRPVGQKRPNELGLYDMSGNVAEWAWEIYAHFRVICGGSWNVHPSSAAMVSHRAHFNPRIGDDTIGFRLVRSAEPESPRGTREIAGWRSTRPTLGVRVVDGELVVHSTAPDPAIFKALQTPITDGAPFTLRFEINASFTNPLRIYSRSNSGPFEVSDRQILPPPALGEWDELSIELVTTEPLALVRINLPERGESRLRNVRLENADGAVVGEWFTK